jgi:hypothetical protein
VTVAEGVESREGWDLLTALGCDQAQGFVVCPPLTSRQFGEWLDRRQPEEFSYLGEAPGSPAAPLTLSQLAGPEAEPAPVAKGHRDGDHDGTASGLPKRIRNGNGKANGERKGTAEGKTNGDGNGEGSGSAVEPAAEP